MPHGILSMDSLKSPLTLLPVHDVSNSSSVPSTCHHDYIPNIELDELSDLLARQVQLDCVVGLD